MRKTVPILLFMLLVAQATMADPSSQIEANRALLARYESEYQRLKSEPPAQASFLYKKNLENLEYKIKALTEDSERLYAVLPERQKADEFMQDLLVKETARRAVASEKAPAANERTRELHENALTLVAQNRLAEASKIYEEIVLEDPDDDEAYIIMGHTYLLTGNYAKAEEAFQNAVHIDSGNAHEITPFYQSMILKNPNDDNARSCLGFAYLILGQTDEARKSFEDALSINPDNQEANYGIRLCAGS